DLNPVRAGISRGLDDSDFTSIQARLLAAADIEGARKGAEARPPARAESADADEARTEGPAASASPGWLVPFWDQCPPHGVLPRIGDYVKLRGLVRAREGGLCFLGA